MGLDSVTNGLDPAVTRARQRMGTVLHGKWHLDQLLGVGGMAAVYSATHRNGTRAAVKVLHSELGSYDHVRSRFLKEGYVANKVDHPGVVRVLDDDIAEDGSLYLVMDLLDGESLEARRHRQGGSIEVDEVLSVTDQVLDVLAVAHDKGIVHRDIKPENIFLTRRGIVKVLDFGIARLRELSTASSATQTGTTLGTPAYMAPEHARGLWEEVDAQSDLWSVGATMFTLATGKLVHAARTPNEQLVAAVTQHAQPILAVAPDLPKPLAEVVDRALAYEKTERWSDAHAMQEGVRSAYHRIRHVPIANYPPLAVPESVPDRTLASVDAPLPAAPGASATGAAVISGRTGVPLGAATGPSMPRAYLIAGVVAAGGAVVIILIVVAVVVGSRMTRAGVSTPASSNAAAESDVRAEGAALDAGVAPVTSAPVVPITDLPSSKSAKPRQPGPTATPPAGPGVPPKPKTDWKDQRR